MVDATKNSDTRASSSHDVSTISTPMTDTAEAIDKFSKAEASQLSPGTSDFSYQQWVRKVFQDPANSKKSDIGVAYRSLNVFGFGTPTDYQKTFANYPLAYFNRVLMLFRPRQRTRLDILQDVEGLVKSGEMLVVLGRPSSGCSTLLKTLAGQTHGLRVADEAEINYQGISRRLIHTEFRGEFSYQAESDIHFPHLTVAQTLRFAAQTRAPRTTGSDIQEYTKDVADATVAALGLAHTLNTKIGSDFVLGVSGGERKRASIAGSLAVVTLYQASQALYDVFDKVVLLYEGRQIFFGDTNSAKTYFISLGFVCSDRATTADFLTSLTNPDERVNVIRKGFEARVPRHPDEFADIWKKSSERASLLTRIKAYEHEFPLDQEQLSKLRLDQKARKAAGQRPRSPYMKSLRVQIKLCIRRGILRLSNDLTPPISSVAGNAIIAIIIGTLFYDMPENTASFFGRGVLLFFTILKNAFLGAFEGVALWDQRPIVQKHFQYAFYHPSAEAMASMICDLPNKVLLTLSFNVPLYFLSNLRRTSGAFFTFYLFAFISLLTGSMIFRTIGAMSRTLTASIAPGATFILLLIVYTGFALPIPNMQPWLRWVAYLNPIGYAFESLMINEFHGRQFPCAAFVPQGPAYTDVDSQERTCAASGAKAGLPHVDGDAYLAVTFQYYPGHLWRNLGFILAIMVVFCAMYLLATEKIPAHRLKGEVLILRRGTIPDSKSVDDEEAQKRHDRGNIGRSLLEKSAPLVEKMPVHVETRATNFLWDGLYYDVKVKDGSLRILDDVDGWVKPGTLTALMGASGAGKTTLLNILANRASTGVVGGEKIIDANGEHQDDGFSRKIGYAQQQDLHLPTSTVREALTFSALLRQSPHYSTAEKISYVDEVIRTLDMTEFADAIIGVPGEGLNVGQRKRLTIGVELVARPELLLFLDEPTSGLDSDTAWSICTLLRKLANNGQAILCTIHQPSGTLFQMFDSLLFLAVGKTLYFGNIGTNSRILIDCFEGYGARRCGETENPAKWLLDITSSTARSEKTISVDWAGKWANSREKREVKEKISRTREALSHPVKTLEPPAAITSNEFASSFLQQLFVVTKRNFEHDWRTPAYLYSKVFLTIGVGIVNGFSFWRSENSLQGIQNQLFSVYLLAVLFSNVVQLIIPRFIDNRTLYEIRDRPSKTYSWQVFILSNVIAEIPAQTVMAILLYITWYYPVGMYRNAIVTAELNERGGLMFLLLWSYAIFCSTFSQMVATIVPDPATGVNIASLLYTLSLVFCGVLVNPSAMPRFWTFMYHVSPITYFVSAIMSTGTAGVSIVCTAAEMLTFDPPPPQSCAQYLADYLQSAGGDLLNPDALRRCQLCPVSSTDNVLALLGIDYGDRWRNFGITWVYNVVNVIGALALYWLLRVPKGPKWS